MGSSNVVVSGRHSQGLAIILDGLDGLFQELARRNDGNVGRAQEFLRPVNDRPHALLDGAILRVDPTDTGERLVLLDVPVQHVIVVPVAYGTKTI